MMFSKAVITFLAIGALCVNVSATPIPFGFPFLKKPPQEDSNPDVKQSFGQDEKLGFEQDVKPGVNPDVKPDVKPGSTLMEKAVPFGELSRSFSALSYHDLTFAFSVGIGAITAGSVYSAMKPSEASDSYNQAGLGSPGGSNPVASPPASKRESVPEDEASDSLSSPLKREPEPAPPSV